MPGHAIFINGIPSAGKSAVAAKLRGFMHRPRTIHGDNYVTEAHDARTRRRLSFDPFTVSAEAWRATLLAIRDALASSNVIVDSALNEQRVVEARATFGDQAMFAILRISEETRARRQDDRGRDGRYLTRPWSQDGHAMTGQDDLYDLVLDAERLSAKDCAREILTFAANRWPEARL